MIRQAIAVVSFLFVTACGAASNHATVASKSHPVYYKVDLTKSKTWDSEVNLMDDSITGEFDGVAVQLPVKKEQLKITLTPGEESYCKMIGINNNAQGAVIKLTVGVEVDNGDSFCELKITSQIGRKGTIHFYEVGG